MKRIKRYFRLLGWFLGDMRNGFRALEMGIYIKRGQDYSSDWKNAAKVTAETNEPAHVGDNPLRKYFDAHKEGNGIWKWYHYFDIYHRHFEKFRGKEVHIVEVGIYSGGSLEMWRQYFGDKCVVYGVDIQKECLVYKKEGIDIFIGDQADRSFWKEFRAKVPRVDIVVDDGGHQSEQQIVTLEELLPVVSNGGVYLCEDVHGSWNNFSDYVHGLQKELNHYDSVPDGIFSSINSPFQQNIHSLHIYPYSVVIEKQAADVPKLSAPRHGTKWEPVL